MRVFWAFLFLLNTCSAWALESYVLAPQVFDRIRVRSLMHAGYTGKEIGIVLLDNGVNFNTPLLSGKALFQSGLEFDETGCAIGRPELYSVNTDGNHGTVVSLIIAGNEFKEGGVIGIAPSSRLAPYATSTNGLYHSARHGLKTHNARITNFSPQFSGLRSQIDEAGTLDSVIVISAGDDYSGMHAPVESLNSPVPENTLVVVAAGPDDQLTVFSRACGGAKHRCVAAPSPDYPAKSTALVSGAIALLMEARPGLPARKYVEALVQTADRYLNPSEATGVGMINVQAALSFLEPLGMEVSELMGLENDEVSIARWLSNTGTFSGVEGELRVRRLDLQSGITHLGIYLASRGSKRAIIKVLPFQNGCRDTENLREFNRLLDDAQGLKNDGPKYARLLQSGHNRRECFQVLELASGVPLSDVFEETLGGRRSLEDGKALFHQVGKKMAEMHLNFMVDPSLPYKEIRTLTHWDMNFGNIFVDPATLEVTLIDLGSMDIRNDFLMNAYYFERMISDLAANRSLVRGAESMSLEDLNSQSFDLKAYFFPSSRPATNLTLRLSANKLLREGSSFTNLGAALFLYQSFSKGYVDAFPEGELKKTVADSLRRRCRARLEKYGLADFIAQ